MKRKINKVGHNTLTVSLPSEWVKENKLEKGDELELEINGKNLILGSEVKKDKKEITIDFTSKKDLYLGRYIIGSYIQGYDTINIKYKDNTIYDYILKKINIMLGFEIIENREGFCKIINISTKMEQDLEIILNRIFMSCDIFLKELFNRIKEGNFKEMNSLSEHKTSINRMALFCKRTINMETKKHAVLSNYQTYTIIEELKGIGEAINRISKKVDKKIKLNKNTEELFENAIKILENNIKIFQSLNLDRNSDKNFYIHLEQRNLRNELVDEMKYFKGDNINSYICNKLLSIVEFNHNLNRELVKLEE